MKSKRPKKAAKPTIQTIVREGAILHSFPILHQGWELDEEGWIYEWNERRFVVLTDHGCKRLATRAELEKKAREYRFVLKGTAAALALLNGGP